MCDVGEKCTLSGFVKVPHDAHSTGQRDEQMISTYSELKTSKKLIALTVICNGLH